MPRMRRPSPTRSTRKKLPEQALTPAPAAPVLRRPPIKFVETQAILAGLEAKLDGPVITYWNNPRGSVCDNDVLAIQKMVERIGRCRRAYLFLKSDGGNGKASLRIVNVLRESIEDLHALVPLECCSAATMIALGANVIHMGPMAYLTPVDTSLAHDLSPIDRDNDRVRVSLDELKRVIRLWQNERDASSINPYQKLFEYVHPLVIGAVDRADSLSTMLCREILSYHLTDEPRIAAIAEALNGGYPSHGYPILPREAKRLGLNIAEMAPEVAELLLELHHVYSEMGQKCTTDLDETRSHTDEILNITEVRGMQLVYEMDKDWFYRKEERRWVTMNDKSGWQRLTLEGDKVLSSELHMV